MAAAESASGTSHSAARCDGDRRPIGADASRERQPLAERTWRKLRAAAASSTRIAQKWRLFTVGGGLRSRPNDNRQNRRASRSADFSTTTVGDNRRLPTTSGERRRRQPGGARRSARSKFTFSNVSFSALVTCRRRHEPPAACDRDTRLLAETRAARRDSRPHAAAGEAGGGHGFWSRCSPVCRSKSG